MPPLLLQVTLSHLISIWSSSNAGEGIDALRQVSWKHTVLAQPRFFTKVFTDALSHGLGAVLLQQINGSWRPVTFASCSISETEQRYAKIKKEALATTWASEKFANFLLEKYFLIKTNRAQSPFPPARSKTP